MCIFKTDYWPLDNQLVWSLLGKPTSPCSQLYLLTCSSWYKVETPHGLFPVFLGIPISGQSCWYNQIDVASDVITSHSNFFEPLVLTIYLCFISIHEILVDVDIYYVLYILYNCPDWFCELT